MFRHLPPYFADRWPYRRYTIDGVTRRVWHVIGNLYLIGAPVAQHCKHVESGDFEQ